MSYDLMVFAPDAAPKDRTSLPEWLGKLMSEASDDPAVAAPALRAWFMEMIQFYPPMNGPLAPPDFPKDETILTDYTIGRDAIYAAFAWSKAENASEVTFRLAEKYGVGLLNVSSERGEMWLPDGTGHLSLAYSD